jgi:sucrose phosphorylase
MRKLSNNEEKVYEANISLFNALQFTDSDLKGKFALKRFIAAHCIILAIEGVPAFYFNSLFATKNDEETFANTGVKRNLNRYKWHYSTLVDLIKTNNTIEKNCYEIFKELISIRKIQPAFHPNATQFTLNLDKNIFAVWRQSRDRKQSIFALTNVSSKTIKLNTNKINLIDDEKWFDLLSQETKITDDEYVKFMPFQSLWITNLKV